MVKDTPNDTFHMTYTDQSGPPMFARHKLQPRILRPNQNSNTFPRKQTKQKWTSPFYLPGHIYKLLSQEAKDALQNYNDEAIQKLKSNKTSA